MHALKLCPITYHRYIVSLKNFCRLEVTLLYFVHTNADICEQNELMHYTFATISKYNFAFLGS